MDASLWNKPRRRSRWRLAAGAAAFRLLRRLQWLRDRRPRARRGGGEFPYVVFAHASPLRRGLAGERPELTEGKIHNLALACRALDGLVIRPGETFSFWRTVGKPCRRRGYRAGLVLSQGRTAAGVGGGLCQLTNLLYWMSAHSDLRVAERWRHSYDVFPDHERTVPFGSGATCVYNYRDLRLVNPGPASYRLSVGLDGEQLRGAWRADREPEARYEVYEAAHWFSQAPNGAYLRHNVLRRRRVGAADVRDEPVAENHALVMYQPFLAGPT